MSLLFGFTTTFLILFFFFLAFGASTLTLVSSAGDCRGISVIVL